MEVLVFDIWGDYGHFRKFYTTTSPLTFAFPPPPTIAGILGAIYGTNKNTNEYLSFFAPDKCRISLRILNPIKKVRMGLNLLETKGKNLECPMSDKGLAPRTQIRTEFIKDPCFRIYFTHIEKEVFDKLKYNIENHYSKFTVSMGLSELLANFQFIGIFEAEEITNGKEVELSTILLEEILIGIIFEAGKKYFKERIPLVMNKERIVEKYGYVIFEPQGEKIKAKVKSYYRLENGENIIFF